jgi:hypothetical protein
MHKEVASRDCMEELKRLAHETKGDKVKEKVRLCANYLFLSNYFYSLDSRVHSVLVAGVSQ